MENQITWNHGSVFSEAVWNELRLTVYPPSLIGLEPIEAVSVSLWRWEVKNERTNLGKRWNGRAIDRIGGCADAERVAQEIGVEK